MIAIASTSMTAQPPSARRDSRGGLGMRSDQSRSISLPPIHLDRHSQEMLAALIVPAGELQPDRVGHRLVRGRAPRCAGLAEDGDAVFVTVS